MADRKQTLIQAFEGMARQFPHYYDEEVVSRLLTDRSLPNREEKLLAALVDMVDGCLDRYEYGITEFLYGAPPMSASVDAVAALEDFGLMKIYSDRSPGSDYDDDRVVRYGDGVLLTSAGEGAAAELAQLGLTGVRLADWTEAGKRFLAENMRELDAWEQEITAEADRKRKVAANLVAWTNRVAFVASIAALGVFLGWIRITVFN